MPKFTSSRILCWSYSAGSSPQAHGREMEAVGRKVVRRLGQFLGSLDELAAAHDVRVRMVDGHLEAEGLQQDVLVLHQLLRLLVVRFRSNRKK